MFAWWQYLVQDSRGAIWGCHEDDLEPIEEGAAL
jgi:hypothetical protein